jgi:phosphoglycerate kinase
MAYTFLRAQGEPTGKSLVEEDKVGLAKEALSKARQLQLPVDHVVAAEVKEGASYDVVKRIPDNMIGVDIGPETIELYSAEIARAKTIIWNGPMGVFEKPPFDRGTVAVAKAVAASGALSVVGGGDSEKAVKAAGVSDKISHISTGKKTSLEFLAKLELPNVATLTDK